MNVMTIAMYYILSSIACDSGLRDISGSLVMMMNFGKTIVGIMAAILILYTNGFLMKQRSKEMGVFNVLGFGKSSLVKLSAVEVLITVGISMTLGIILGVVFKELVFMILNKILGYTLTFSFNLSIDSILATLFHFSLIYGFIFIFNMVKMWRMKTLDLMKASESGQKEPKSKWLLSIVGLLCLSVGYYLAISIEEPLMAISAFFIAVILVIIGTYALFTSISIILLKALRKNKNIYYQVDNFVNISVMLHRMKQNAAGLASICVLSTMVLLTVATTVSMYAGFDDVLKDRYPTDFTVIERESNVNESKEIATTIEALVLKHGVEIQKKEDQTFAFTVVKEEENRYERATTFSTDDAIIYLTDDSKFKVQEQTQGSKYSLKENEVLVYCSSEIYPYDTIVLGGKSFNIKEKLTNFGDMSMTDMMQMKTIGLVFNDFKTVKKLFYQLEGKPFTGYTILRQFDFSGSVEQEISFGKDVMKVMNTNWDNVSVMSRQLDKDTYFEVYGGLYFIGIFLGALFVMMTALIIYYKQVSEGLDDKERYSSMQKVGMCHVDIKRNIRKQIIWVFSLPIIVAVIHVSVAFKMMTRLLAIMNFTNVSLFALCTIVTIIVFTLIYWFVYQFTAKTYFSVVKFQFEK
jgi:putative ABC transport system permease protein